MSNNANKPNPKTSFSLSELLKEEKESIDCLVEPILPRCGLAALIGSSDSGKSTLLRQLAASIVSKKPFLLWKTKSVQGKVLYISTEDEPEAISYLVKRQNKSWQLNADAQERLEFVFDSDSLMYELNRKLQCERFDLVIIDSLSDVFSGDINRMDVMREQLRLFNQMAIRNRSLIVFLHHTRKSSDSDAPSKHNAIGSQGFEAKMRVVLELRRNINNSDLFHLCIVKGNYLSNEYKRASYDLTLTSDLCFEYTGERTPIECLMPVIVPTCEKPKRGKTSQEKKDEVIRLYNLGLNAKSICEKMQLGRTRVYEILSEYRKQS